MLRFKKLFDYLIRVEPENPNLVSLSNLFYGGPQVSVNENMRTGIIKFTDNVEGVVVEMLTKELIKLVREEIELLKERKRETNFRLASEHAIKNRLPVLTGSFKDIRFATFVRYQAFIKNWGADFKRLDSDWWITYRIYLGYVPRSWHDVSDILEAII